MHDDNSSASMHMTNGNNSTLMPMAQSHTIKGRCHLRVALPVPPNHSSGEALLQFRQVASVTSEPSTSGQFASSPVATIHEEPSSTIPPYLKTQVGPYLGLLHR
ncbi:hypothetical protein PIB30_073790 [Stylosanthes scabra]|uniref:Uncharacterized protein n=1 Tax=Stylosanthes scabra TaxID=79078 RepID=A0ABU6ZN43_9FABA|nr:hypothetical protein [Stylosanthes scabra]